MKPILEVQHLSKEFYIGAQQEPYLALRDMLASPTKLLSKQKKEVFKALDDVSFNVMPGESIGIIGRNGAGKSTLLKILSKITPPSSGKIICRGRIAALLEVGTGFHAELTGRENIYMNGSILGMRKWEIDKHFDEIVDFSGVEKFLDTPLKRYSSGMQLRLAFAVAAHLEPEILIIDEVLAVGDAEFQKKCLGKMDEVTKSGRTVLFVSHDMGTISKLCGKSILLSNGILVDYQDTEKIINQYKNSYEISHSFELRFNSFAKISSLYTKDDNGNIKSQFSNNENIIIEFSFDYLHIAKGATILITVKNQNQTVIFSDENEPQQKFRLKINKNFLVQGLYYIDFTIHNPPTEQYLKNENAISFEIIDVDSKFIIYNNYNYNYGVVFPKTEWIY